MAKKTSKKTKARGKKPTPDALLLTDGAPTRASRGTKRVRPVGGDPKPLEETMNYQPTLKSIAVPLDELLLDPNNPRILSDTEYSESQFSTSGVQTQAHDRMKAGNYRLDELKQSILKNGWQPVDMIFVKRLADGRFVVLEGNRRLCALRSIARDGMPENLRTAVDPLPVFEVVGTGNLEESRAQISYLLGVRHHGSLKVWAPFARAHNIYERYLQYGKMTDDSFSWNAEVAQRVGDTLGIDPEYVEEALMVYRVMKQLNSQEAINRVGMEGRYYSLIREVLSRPAKSPLHQYVVLDPNRFALDDASLARIDKVCRFSTKDRQDAPVSAPVEWRSLEKILADHDEAKKTEMLHQVEDGGLKPSVVYAMRAAELRQPRWDRWLKEVADLLKSLQVGGLQRSDEARRVSSRLATVLEALNAVAAEAKE